MKNEEKEFIKYLENARAKFCSYTNSLKWNNELRTEVDDFLIAYDQAVEYCKKKIVK